MLKFKIFSALDHVSVEQQVNAWLMEAEPEVKMMEQSIMPTGATTVSFLYDAGFMANELTVTAEATAIVEEAQRQEPTLEPIRANLDQV